LQQWRVSLCNEFYLSYYEHPTQARLKRIDELMRDADRVNRVRKNAGSRRCSGVG
jgi:hypothetical protein